ncbi:MAG: signal peptidase I [Ignavibacteria bacterium]|nr:signal peptidase I [Ignavibacteria bacterium]
MEKQGKTKVNVKDNFFKQLWHWYKERRRIAKEKRKKPKTFGEAVLSWVKTILGALIIVMFINGLLVASFVVPTGSMENTVMTGDFLFVNKFIYGPTTPQIIPFLNIPLPYIKFPGIKEPERGDVIVFVYPGDRDEIKPREFQYYLKRCVAIAGDTIQIVNKKIFVNGVERPLPSTGKLDPSEPLSPFNKWETFPPGRGFTRDNYGPLRVPKAGDTIYINSKNWREWEYFIKKENQDVYFDGVNLIVDGKPSNYYIVKRDYCFAMGDNQDHSSDSRYWGFVPYENVVGAPLFIYMSWDTDIPLFNIVDKVRSIRWGRIFSTIK